jgi:putative ABC transport system permease protein
LLAALGGVFGFVLAHVGLAGWRAWGPADFPQMAEIAIDWHVLLFAAVLSGVTALACGAAPAWFASRGEALPVRDAARTTTTNRAQRAVQQAFVAAQIAAATVLLVSMLLMARGLARLEQVPPGFTPSQALSVQLSLPPGVYGNPEALMRFFETLRDRLSAIPGVESAGVVSLPPLSGLLSTADIALPDRPAPPQDEVPQAHLRVATAEYFDAAGIDVLQGRSFDDHDRQEGQRVAIVSRTFAARHWPRESAVGKAVQIAQANASPRLEVVGVVSDVKQFTLDAPATADLYVPLHQMPTFQAPLIAARMYWVVRGRFEVATLTQAIRSAVAQVDPGVAASSMRTLESLWRTSLVSRRANVRLLEVFADVAVVLCALGVYGVAAFAARTRRRELAIRAALGGSRRELTIFMLRRELWPVLLGLVVGLVIAAGAAPVLFGGVFGISPRDGTTYLQVAAILLVVAVVATYIPVRRAGATDPSEALSA